MADTTSSSTKDRCTYCSADLLHAVSTDEMIDLSYLILSSYFFSSFFFLSSPLLSWSWGWNKYGQVGDDSAEDALRPHSVQLSRSSSPRQQQYVRSITAGLRHTIVLTASQQLFGWGLLHLTNSSSSSSSCGSEVQQQQQGSVQSPPVSFIPKNISHCVPSLTGHALSPGGSSDNLFLALTGSSSSSLSFVALDMCSSSREGGGNNQSRRAVGGRRSEKKQIARTPTISRSLSKSPARRGTSLDTTAAPLAVAVTAARRKDATQKQQQQFNTVLYKVDKPAANTSQVSCLYWSCCCCCVFLARASHAIQYISLRMKRSSRSSRGSRAGARPSSITSRL